MSVAVKEFSKILVCLVLGSYSSGIFCTPGGGVEEQFFSLDGE